ncbi:TetR/AcrR family transcriptional regulator [Fictibacillus sp. Mic-4]|uniref:TetR/AcrR family transcriptional regulator n=1 Tax=Fictibacillus TaxID=1329200 RepID=UPI00040A23ED|nr:TetR/AcrR family transcriptional regulator [Fictibacillus gelatini]
MPKVSEEYKVKKRELLMESALSCFAEKGYQSTTMDDIVAKSKASKGVIYNYFKSKEELYLSLMEERTNRTFAFLAERFENMQTASEKIRELFRIYREATLNKKWQEVIQVHMEFWINSARAGHLREIMMNRYKNQYQSFLASIIDEGQKNGEFRKALDSKRIASLFWAFIDGLCTHYSVIGDDYDYKHLFKETEEMMFLYLARS